MGAKRASLGEYTTTSTPPTTGRPRRRDSAGLPRGAFPPFSVRTPLGWRNPVRGPTGFIRAQPSYIGDAGWSSWHGRCIPEGLGSIIGRKRGVFDPLFGKPAEKTRAIEQTRKAGPRNFPPVPTRPPATETERFRPVPLPPIFENPGFSGPGFPSRF